MELVRLFACNCSLFLFCACVFVALSFLRFYRPRYSPYPGYCGLLIILANDSRIRFSTQVGFPAPVYTLCLCCWSSPLQLQRCSRSFCLSFTATKLHHCLFIIIIIMSKGGGGESQSAFIQLDRVSLSSSPFS